MSMRSPDLVTDRRRNPVMTTVVPPGFPRGGTGSSTHCSPTFRAPASLPEQVIAATQEVDTSAASALRRQSAMPLVRIAPRGSQTLTRGCTSTAQVRATSAVLRVPTSPDSVRESFRGSIVAVIHDGGLRIIGPAIAAPVVDEGRAGPEVTVRLIHAEVTTGGMRFQAVAA